MADLAITPAPSDVVDSVERYVDKEYADARQYENRSLLDESGVYSLHQLVAQAYARGWADGERVAATKERGRRQRERDAS